ncbi:MAG: serine/threonine-protein kinase [Rhodococcus sp. (in: high G+C Gram-positive bacteria)]|uniref:serine/threonine-protein kinase n=1 Tax=Rhodococcus sp. TaxID=1831 RepID=UPI003BB12CE1
MQVGARFGRYRLDRPLTMDANGEVWSAVDTVTLRQVAVRALPPEATEDDDYRERFERAAGIAAHIQNPHVMPIHDFGQVGNRLFLATPLIEGTYLQTILESTGPMNVDRAVAVAGQLASALDALRAAGLPEPEVSSANVFMQDGGAVYLTGTWLPASPGAASGICGLTAVLYECLTGRFFPSSSPDHLPPRPSSVMSTLPAGMDAVIARGTAADPAVRYRSAGELAAAARAAATAPRPGAEPNRVIPPISRSRGGMVAGVALAAIVAVAIVGGIVIGSGSSSSDVSGTGQTSSAEPPAWTPPAPAASAPTAPSALTSPTAEAEAPLQTQPEIADAVPLEEAVPPSSIPQPAPQVSPAPQAPTPAAGPPQVLPCYPGYEHTPPPDGPCLPPGSPPPPPAPAPAAPAPAQAGPEVLPCYPGYEHTPPPDGPCWAPAR